MGITLFFLFAGLGLLFVGGDVLVRGSAALATRFRISPFIIGVTVVGFGTSTPELLVSVNAALKGAPDIALGNVVGSNIANILLILGAAAIISPIAQKLLPIRRDVAVMIGASFLLYGLSFTGTIDQLTGLVLVIGLLIYLGVTIFTGRNENLEADDNIVAPMPLIKSIGFIAAGLVALIFGADWLVGSATEIARMFAVPEAVIGLTIVAVGTSLPELATSIVAAFKRNADIAVGNVIGSNTFNILGILGLTGVISPIAINPAIRTLDMPMMLATALLLIVVLASRQKIDRVTGFVLLAVYAGYIAYLF
jgi:cation:H+ antiporter